MALKVYRIDTGILGKLFGLARKTDLPPEKAFVGAASLNLVRTVSDLVNYDNHYVIKDENELSRFINPLGNSWINREQYYIRHPKQARERYLIEAEHFHEYIYREQISEIISYLRSSFSIKHLEIICENEAAFDFSAKVPIEELQVEGETNVKLKNRKELIIDCPRGLKISERRSNYIWIDDFAELKTIADDFEGGEFKHTIEIENSFGMGIKECKTIGIKGSLAQRQKFHIRFNV